MEVEPRSRAMRQAKDEANRKRRTTVIESPQSPVQPWTGVRWFYGSFMACRPASTPLHVKHNPPHRHVGEPRWFFLHHIRVATSRLRQLTHAVACEEVMALPATAALVSVGCYPCWEAKASDMNMCPAPVARTDIGQETVHAPGLPELG